MFKIIMFILQTYVLDEVARNTHIRQTPMDLPVKKPGPAPQIARIRFTFRRPDRCY